MAGTSELLITLGPKRQIRAQAGVHSILTDQPVSNGGEDTAPSPFQLFLASVGTCAGIFIQGFCAKREIPYEDIRIVQKAVTDDTGTLRSVDLEVQLPPDFPEKYREAVLKVADQCSVKRAIAAQPEFTLRATPREG